MRTFLIPLALAAAAPLLAQSGTPSSPLTPADVESVARLLQLEDTRTFDAAVIVPLLDARHPEVRRRAALAIGHIRDARGSAVLRGRPLDGDTSLAATTVFAVAQLKDTAAISWLDSILTNAATAPTVAVEAARGLGMVNTPRGRAALATYLARAIESPRNREVIGEALLSIGRHATRGDLAPITRWTGSSDEEIRWRATWALYRPADPAAIDALLGLAADRSPLVRMWALRALVVPRVDSAGARARALGRLIDATRDSNRWVHSRAVLSLAGYDEPGAVDALGRALDSPDEWISGFMIDVPAVGRNAAMRPLLKRAAEAGRPCVVRRAALRALVPVDTAAALAAARSMVNDSTADCRTEAAQTVARLTGAPRPQANTTRPPAPPARTFEDYKRIVERWIVPRLAGEPLPRVRWTTARGDVEIELFAGDAPMAADEMARLIEAGALVGTSFTRTVPVFVAQQQSVPGARSQREETNRNRLGPATVAWANAGYDRGSPGYTLGITPQPHNEGEFTAIGRIVGGMAAVERIQAGDRVTAAVWVSGRRNRSSSLTPVRID